MNLSKKTDIAIERLRFGEKHSRGKPLYLCQSGGNDSCVIEHLAKRSGVPFISNHNLPGIDHPELVRHLRRHYPNTIIHRAEKTFGEFMIDRGFPPLRQIRWCCELLKEGAGEGVVVIGIRWAESNRRKSRRWFEACRRDKAKNYLSPIIDWSDSDVWEYIHHHKLPYCELYDAPHNYHRLGCLMCPMASKHQRKRESIAYPGYKKLYMRWFERLYEHRKATGKPLKNWDSPEQFFDFWMEDEMALKEHAGQMCLAFDS